ncbi:MAG: Flp family type IVb pilin [Sphingomonadales bacterium]|nr:MAG: Flp family type IVb pilin [Sphingomonadales bacterium]
MTFVKTFVRDESGASAAEYALILAVVGAAIALGALFLGGAIGSALNETGTCIDDPNTTNCTF